VPADHEGEHDENDGVGRAAAFGRRAAVRRCYCEGWASLAGGAARRGLLFRLDAGEQVGGLDIEGRGDREDLRRGGVSLASLDSAHVIRVRARRLGELLLGPCALQAQRPHILAEPTEDPLSHPETVLRETAALHTL